MIVRRKYHRIYSRATLVFLVGIISLKCFCFSFDSLPVLDVKSGNNTISIPDSIVFVLTDNDVVKSDLHSLNLRNTEVYSEWKSKSEFPKKFHITIAFKLRSHSFQDTEWWINIPGTYSKVRVVRANGLSEEYESGTMTSYHDRPVKYGLKKMAYYPLHMHSDEEVVVVAEMKQTEIYQIGEFDLLLHTPIYAQYLENETHNYFFDGALNALAFILAFYCFFTYFSSSQSFLLWQALYSLLSIVYLRGYVSGLFRLNFDPTLILYLMFVLVLILLVINNFFLRQYLNLASFSPLWNKLLRYETYIFLGLIVITVIFFSVTHHFLYTVYFLLLISTLHQCLFLFFGIRLFKSPEPYVKVLGVGLITIVPTFLISHILMIYDLLDGYVFTGVGTSIYLLSIVLSIGQRTASVFKAREKENRIRIRNQIKIEEVKKMSEFKSHLFTNISHELRTPLTLIIGPLKSVLSDSNISERSTKLLETAKSNSENLLKMVSSILDISKMDAGKFIANEKFINLKSFCEDAISGLAYEAKRKGITFQFVYDAAIGLEIKTDPNKINSIVENLVSNALKYSDENGTVSLTVSTEDENVTFLVEDTGRGIHSEDIDHVFDRFYQSEWSHIPMEGGSGIGLSICKEYVNLLNGEISVNSQLGVGSIFIVKIPMIEKRIIEGVSNISNFNADSRESNIINQELDVNKEISINPNLKHILIVEDNYELRDYLVNIVSKKYNVQCANNGREAIKILGMSDEENTPFYYFNHLERTNHNPDLIITDLMMPVMDGYSLIARLKKSKEWNRTPLIILSARADAESKVRALRIGVDDYMVKPFDEDELMIRIKNLLLNLDERRLSKKDEESNNESNDNNKEENGLPNGSNLSLYNREWLEDLESYILENIESKDLNIESIAKHFSISSKQLNRRIKKMVGLTTHKYIIEIKLNKAQEILLNNRDISVKSVSLSVGIKKPDYFSQLYFNRFGKRPSDYINK